MKLNILFVLNSLCFGGAEKHVVSLLNNLNTNDFGLFLIYLKDDTTLISQINSKKLKDITLFEVDGISIPTAKNIGHYIEKNKIDIILCTNQYPLLYGWLSRLFSTRKPKLIEVFHSTALPTIKENIHMTLFWPIFWLSDALVYVCENQKRYWSRRTLSAKQVFVIHNGIDTQYFSDIYSTHQKLALRQQFNFNAEDYVVGICAAMRPEKHHKDLLQAIKHLAKKGLNVKALLIGDGPQKAEIERKIELLGLKSDVKITGFQADVRPLISACDVMAITSHHVETFSIAALEAMSLGKPMIMTDIGGASEQVEHGKNGYIYPHGDIDALSNAIENLMPAHKRQQMGNLAQELVRQRFSLAGMVNSYAKLFLLLNNRSSHYDF